MTSERVNMSGKVLEKHYEKGTSAEKAERRRDHISDIICLVSRICLTIFFGGRDIQLRLEGKS